jgi:hypothetical protein
MIIEYRFKARLWYVDKYGNSDVFILLEAPGLNFILRGNIFLGLGKLHY